MDRIDLTGTLAFGTIGIVLVIAAFLLARFLRKPANQHPMDGQRERNIEEILDDSSAEKAPRPGVD